VFFFPERPANQGRNFANDFFLSFIATAGEMEGNELWASLKIDSGHEYPLRNKRQRVATTDNIV
jgi:hypothetical protein